MKRYKGGYQIVDLTSLGNITEEQSGLNVPFDLLKCFEEYNITDVKKLLKPILVIVNVENRTYVSFATCSYDTGCIEIVADVNALAYGLEIEIQFANGKITDAILDIYVH